MNLKHKLTSVFLAMLMLLYALPLTSLASEDPVVEPDQELSDIVLGSDNADVEAVVVGEVISERTERTKTFRLSDGSYVAADYGRPVHYLEDDVWVDFDNTLVDSPVVLSDSDDFAGYITSAGDVRIKLANNSNSSNLVKIQGDEYKVSMHLVGADKSKAVELYAPLPENEVPSMELTKFSSGAIYKDILPSVDLEYIISGNSVKENIIVKEKRDNYTFTFELKINGLTPTLLENGDIALNDSMGETKMLIPAAYMFDANGVFSDEVEYSLEHQNGQKYLLTVTADASWMNADDRAYPVTIDPPLYAGSYLTSEVDDGYVYEGSPTEVTGSYEFMIAGYDVHSTSLRTRSYVKLNTLPTLPQSSVIVEATLNLRQVASGNGWKSYTGTASSITFGARKITSSWSESTLNWNTKPSTSSIVLDYQTVTASTANKDISWDITSAVQDWYNGSTNYGIAIYPVTEYSGSGAYAYTGFYSSENPNVYNTTQPMFTINYRDNKGIEGIWSFNSHGASSASTGNINLFSGNLVYIHSDITSHGSVLPLNVSHVYNASYSGLNYTSSTNGIITADYSGMLVGRGFKLSVQETIVEKTIGNELYYVYSDQDGTELYFKWNSSENAYVSEDGYGLKITKNSSNIYTMSDDYDNTKTFSSGGYITELKDVWGNKQVYRYSTSYAGRITSIEYYPAGQTTTRYILSFSYNSSNYLNKIQSIATATGSVIAYTEFLYGSYNGTGSTTGTGYLREIKRYSGSTLTDHTKIDYNSATVPGVGTDTNGLITKVSDVILGSCVEYTYLTNEPMITSLDHDKRIYNVKEKYGDSTGQQLGFIYENKKTSIRTSGKDDAFGNSDDMLTTYLFDNYSRTINAYTSDLNGTKIYGVTNAEYNTTDNSSAANFASTYRKNNTITKDAYTGIPAKNYIIDSSAELSSGSWNKTESTTSQTATIYAAGTGESFAGTKSFRLNSTGTSGTAKYSQTVYVPTTGYYTFSAYVKTDISTGNGAYITLNGVASEKIAGTTNSEINNGWQRISVTVNITSTGNKTVELVLADSKGTALFDCVQLEPNDTPSTYNFISNNTKTSPWTVSSTSSVTFNDGNVTMVGNASGSMYTYADITLNLPATTTFVLSGWATANSVKTGTFDGVDKFYSLRYKVYYTDGTSDSAANIDFNDDNTNRQFTSGAIIPLSPAKTISKIRVYMRYDGNCNTAVFESPSLVIAPAQYYDYDDKGNLTQSVNADGNDTNIEYMPGEIDIKSYTNILGEKYEYTYYSLTHEPQTITKTDYEKTLTTEYEYDEFGNTTSTEVTNNQNSLQMSSSSIFGDYGNFLTSVTDGRGIVTNYTYDTLKELLTSTNVGGNRVYRYLYDTKDRITKVYLDRDKDSVVDSADEAVSYAYNSKGYLTSLTTPNSGTYTIAYDNFGNTSSIKAGSFTLAQYVYNANNGKLNKTTYGNGFYTENVYDELDRIIQIKYNGTVKYSFKYNGDGQLYSATDVPNNTITYYEYDSNGRLLRARLKENTSTGSVLLNTENKFDNLGRAVKSVYDLQKLGEKMTYTVSYKGNADVTSGRIASFGLPNGKSISYGYDKFDRLTSKSMGLTASAGIAENYSYWTSGNKTANLITSHSLTTPGGSIAYNYTYDDYGNILTVKEGSTLKLSYVYDDLNQLTRENNAYANKTYVYTYDKNGNILTKKTYAYTTGTLGTVQSTINYTYGNSSWKDLLTSYNGTAISYDGSGNPTNWRGNLNTLTWTGRELTGITMPSSQTMSYKYNADGIRTQKTFTDNAVKYYYKHDYILDGAKVVAETINYVTYMGTNTTEVLYYYYDEAGAPTGIKYNNNVYYFQKNLQGDIIRILNSSGTVVATYTYDAWGNIIASTDTSGVSIGTKNPFRYRGYYYDTETGLYYLNSRYYDPQVGRFLNADAVIAGITSDVKGYNMFAYCFNNPVNMTDSFGNWPSWGQVLTAAAIVVSAAVVVTAIVASAGTVGIAFGATASVYLGTSAATASFLTTAVTVGSYGVAAGIGVCALSNAGEVLTGTNVIRDYALDGNYKAYDAIQTGLNFAGMAYFEYASNAPSVEKSSKLEKYVKNPNKLKKATPQKIEKIANAEGLHVGTLSKGNHQGQGMKVTWGGDRLIQYHPGKGHHGENPYWKVSSGEHGVIRVFLE